MTSTLQRTLYNSTYRPRLNLSLSQFSRPNLYCSSSIHFFQSPPRAMPTYPGSCYCRDIEYELSLASPDDARTSLCHCKSCKKAFGTNYGLTAKIPKDALRLIKGAPKEHVADNGSGSLIHREFCSNCGSFICEYGVGIYDTIPAGCDANARRMPSRISSATYALGPWMIPKRCHQRASSSAAPGPTGCQRSPTYFINRRLRSE
ncbi:Mss4-like protein [Aspergillus flavus]|uniref:Mss4-like protein n=2 Tax=Aspergillus subgen. Circumdati TaxID=2720871 RepID=A0A7U2MK86_ASPFN|nr:hypothetical protein Ao3042_08712 [Aspergillus oryzae 3.042]KDE76175.1 hypothetical protein AO1008_01966 [Aspergillus oryzae 100-8]QRD85239.1 Mss4-like protein [Aspergillus flavus]UDD59156.1 hypothetical protein AFCA_006577 [Aspergillus flavus]|eukprot:EIT75047.1 hypothetical protein Ao3042_08712 [Aspergillus oryzae 3.042]